MGQCRFCRHNVLVEVEDVAGVVGLDAVRVIRVHEVDVAASLGVGAHRLLLVPHPLDVGRVVRRVVPPAGNDGTNPTSRQPNAVESAATRCTAQLIGQNVAGRLHAGHPGAELDGNPERLIAQLPQEIRLPTSLHPRRRHGVKQAAERRAGHGPDELAQHRSGTRDGFPQGRAAGCLSIMPLYTARAASWPPSCGETTVPWMPSRNCAMRPESVMCRPHFCGAASAHPLRQAAGRRLNIRTSCTPPRARTAAACHQAAS
jgi:hypothetical protein